MKNIISKAAALSRRAVVLTLAFILICSTAVCVLAASPSKPIFHSQMPDCNLFLDSDPITLWSDVSVSDGGKLIYQWYKSSSSKINTIKAIGGADNSTYTPPVKEGTVYYCLGVWNQWSDGQESEPAYSRMIKVTYEQRVAVASELEIMQNPSKMKYKVGEKVSLKGLRVRIWTDEGYIDSKDGKDLKASPKELTKAGKQKIKLSYQDVSVSFTVTVEEDHVHEFGEWELTTPATCTTEGEETRSCSCGEKEARPVPVAEHTWDNGRLATKPTPEHDGVTVYTCKECGVTKNEKVEYREVSEEVSKPDVESSMEPTAEPETSEPQPQQPTSSSIGVSSMLLWVLLGAAALLIAAVVVIVVVVLTRKNK